MISSPRRHQRSSGHEPRRLHRRPRRQLRLDRSGTKRFVFGAGQLVHSFVAANAVDTPTVGIVPVPLGGGRSLSLGEHPTTELRLTDYAIAAGKVRLVYARR